jgi:hypothetical protein
MSDRNLTDLRRPLTLDTARPEPTTHRVDRPSLNEVVWLPTRELDAMDIALLDEIARHLILPGADETDAPAQPALHASGDEAGRCEQTCEAG